MVQLTEMTVRGKARADKLEDVKSLNLWGQDLTDISILGRLPNVEVLSLSVNRISSLKDFSNCSKLQELYLRKNEVADLAEVYHLAGLQDLRVLWLSDNPCAELPQYKATVLKILPQLQKLDNDDLSGAEREVPTRRASAASATPLSDRGGSAVKGSPARTPPAAAYSPDPYSGSAPHSAQRQRDAGGHEGRSTKNILYAVMALLGELEDEDLVYVRREVDQRLGR